MIEFMSNKKRFADAKSTPHEGKNNPNADSTHDCKRKRNGLAWQPRQKNFYKSSIRR
jgi:hypothetical protein